MNEGSINLNANKINNTIDLKKREDDLISLGFTKDFIDKLYVENKTLYSKETVESRMGELKQLGFNDPVALITRSAPLITLDLDNIKGSLQAFTNYGFSDPMKIIEINPSILGRKNETVKDNMGYIVEKLGKEVCEKDPVLLGINKSLLEERINNLSNCGITNAIEVAKHYPSLLHYPVEKLNENYHSLVAILGPNVKFDNYAYFLTYDKDNLKQRVEMLTNNGIKLAEIIRNPKLMSFTEETLNNKINFIQNDLKIVNIKKILKLSSGTSLLGVSNDALTRRKVWLEENGFKNMDRIAARAGRVFTISEDLLSSRFQEIKELGFSDVPKILLKYPQLLTLKTDLVREKIEIISSLGFTNATSLVEKFPPIIGYSKDRVGERLEELRGFGFNNPILLIEGNPAILSFSKERIENRIRIIDNICRKYNIPFTGIGLMSIDSALWSSKEEKLLIITRIMEDICTQKNDVNTTLIKKLLRLNIEDLLYVYSDLDNFSNTRFSNNTESDLDKLTITADQTLIKEIPKEEKITVFRRLLATNNPKILNLYDRGYHHGTNEE